MGKTSCLILSRELGLDDSTVGYSGWEKAYISA
jgi:hypothetical protein